MPFTVAVRLHAIDRERHDDVAAVFVAGPARRGKIDSPGETWARADRAEGRAEKIASGPATPRGGRGEVHAAGQRRGRGRARKRGGLGRKESRAAVRPYAPPSSFVLAQVDDSRTSGSNSSLFPRLYVSSIGRQKLSTHREKELVTLPAFSLCFVP